MKSLLDGVRCAVEQGRAPTADVRTALAQAQDPTLLRRAGRMLADLSPGDGLLRPVRVALLATCTTGSLPYLLRAALVGAGLQPTIEPAGYGTFELTLAGAAYTVDGDPDLVACLLDDGYFTPADWSGADVPGLISAIQARFGELRGLIAASGGRSTATLVLHTVPLPVQTLDAIVSWRGRAALARAWHQLNADILALAEEHAQVTVVDLVSLLAAGAAATRDERLHRYGDMPYTDAALLAFARQVARVAQARAGLSRKVLALDLDNTLWGGVLGEVGAQGVQLGGLYPGNCYLELQRTARRLREQGVILVLLSKNDPGPVEEALRDHPAMVLRADAFSATSVNWLAKAQNLRAAAQTLEVGTQSFVFMDDSPFERGEVAHELPEVALIAADGDPSYLVDSLLRPGYFDAMALTETDLSRPRLYRDRAQRSEFSGAFSSTEEYLAALAIELAAERVGSFSVARVAQLAARTNQFNLTGVRFDEASTAAMSEDPAHLVAAFSVTDRFGDEGIVGAAWVRREGAQWSVLNLVLSCRVLSRGVELAVVGWLVNEARRAGASALRGRFVPSGKNEVARDLWERAGFGNAGQDGEFALDLSDGTDPTPAWINVRERSVV